MPEHKVILIKDPTIIQKHWYSIKPLVVGGSNALARGVEAFAVNVLEALLTDTMQLWVIMQDEQIAGIAVTSTCTHKFTGNTFLMIDVLQTLTDLPPEAWKSLLDNLEGFARDNSCVEMLTYVTTETMAAFTQITGFSDNVHLMHKEVTYG